MKLFSIEEAHALLPFLRRSLAIIVEQRKALRLLAPEVQRAQEQADLGGGTKFGPAYVESLLKFQHEAQKIELTGVLVKDYDLGLCDFPTEINGEVVHLCWKLSEKRISWWHKVDAGFAGRQPLD